jgi:branched-chain amino acid transport system permease protein
MAVANAPEPVAPAPPAGGRRPITDIDWARTLRVGLLAGLAMAFVAAIGMFEALDSRPMIVPILSLGYLSIGWVPFVAGYLAAKEETLEGLEPPQKGSRDLLAGLLAGLIGGFLLWLLAVFMDAFEWREVFLNLSPGLLEMLTFGRGLGFGFVALVVGSGGLGLLGGALAVPPDRVRRLVTGAIVAVFVVAILEVIFVDIFEGIGLGSVTDRLYDINGGLAWGSAIVVAAIGALVAWSTAGASGRSRSRWAAMPDTQRRTAVIVAFAVVAFLTIFLPIIMGGIVNELLANVGLFLLMGLGLNIVVGYAGLLDLGYVAFFAVGAYTTAVLTSPISPTLLEDGAAVRETGLLTVDFFSWEGWVVLVAVLIVAAIAGIVVGTPVIRMRGDYLAIVTLGFGEIVRILFLSDWLAPVFGGAQGVRQIPAAELDFVDVTITGVNPQSIFYFAAVFVAIAIYVSWRLSKSRIGRAWAAMREDESVAEAMGIDTVRAKLLAFVIGAMLASFGGMVFAVKVGSVFPKSFELLVSIIVLVVVIVGGMGNIPGVIVGALVLIGVLGGPTQPGVLQEFQQFKLLIYGALLVYMMLQRPQGLVPSVRRSRELHHEEMLQDAWLASALDEEEAAEGGAA